MYDHASTSLPPSLHHWTSDMTLLIPNFSSVCHILLGFSSLSVALFLFLSHHLFFFFNDNILLSHLHHNLLLHYSVIFCFVLFLILCWVSSLLWCHMLKWWPYYSQGVIITRVLMTSKAIFLLLIYTPMFQMYIFNSLLDTTWIFQR